MQKLKSTVIGDTPPDLNLLDLIAQVPAVDLQPGLLSCHFIKQAPDVGQLLLIQAPHFAHHPALRLVFLLQLQQHGRAFALQLLDPLDVIGQAVVEVPEIIFLLVPAAGGATGAHSACDRCGDGGGHCGSSDKL